MRFVRQATGTAHPQLNVDDVMRLTSETLKNTGNREIGLLSLSTAGHSQVESLTKKWRFLPG
jgi:hypothetical protein